MFFLGICSSAGRFLITMLPSKLRAQNPRVSPLQGLGRKHWYRLPGGAWCGVRCALNQYISFRSDTEFANCPGGGDQKLLLVSVGRSHEIGIGTRIWKTSRIWSDFRDSQTWYPCPVGDLLNRPNTDFFDLPFALKRSKMKFFGTFWSPEGAFWRKISEK